MAFISGVEQQRRILNDTLLSLPAKASNSDSQHVPTFDFATLEPLVRNRATILLEAKLGALVPEIFNHLYHTLHEYDSVCFCSENWQGFHSSDYYGTYSTREEVQRLLYSYIFKRGASTALIEADGYIVNERHSSMTDPAFMEFFNTIITRVHGILQMNPDLKPLIRDIAGHGRTVMIAVERTIVAFRIFTQEPMKFKVQKKVGHCLEAEEIAIVRCEDTEPKGCWITELEYMRKPMARCIHPDTKYEFW